MSLVAWLMANRAPLELAKELARTAKENAHLQERVHRLETEIFWLRDAVTQPMEAMMNNKTTESFTLDRIAEACAAVDISDSQFESLSIELLHGAPPTNKESLTVAAQGKPVTVDTPEFRATLSTYNIGEMSETSFIAYIDAHTAQAVAAKQAEIDRLMLEFCPNEMSAEQMATWEASQRRAPEASPQQHAQAALSDEQIYDIMAASELGIGRDDHETEIRFAFARAILTTSQQPATAPTWKCASCGATSADGCIASGCAACEQDGPAAAPAAHPQESEPPYAFVRFSIDYITENKPALSDDVIKSMIERAWKGYEGIIWRAALAAPAAQVAAVPEGWAIVPKKPTPEMVEAGCNADPERESVWAAYLSAAPSPAQPAPASHGNWPQDFRDVIKSAEDAAHQMGRAAGIEEAAKACEAERVEVIGAGDESYNFAIKHSAAAIRILSAASAKAPK